MKNSAWVSVGNTGTPPAVPVGSLCILGRGQPSWQRHVCRTTVPIEDDGSFETIGGNEGNTVGLTKRNAFSSDVRGFIVYP